MSRGKDTPQGTSPQRHWKQYVSLGVAIVTCPCHVPILLGTLAGTALGGWLYQYTPVVFLALDGVFILSLYYGLKRH